MSHPLDGTRLKIDRAEKHLNEVLKLLRRYENGDYTLVPEEQANAKAILRVNILPKVDQKLSVIIGDFLFNIRSALDHMVWQLVLANGVQPRLRNLFPICLTPESFGEAIGKHKRLDGVSIQARAVIESLQPYPGRDTYPLAMLSRLHKIDKHQILIPVSAATPDALTDGVETDWNTETQIIALQLPSLTSILFNQEFRDGAIIPVEGLILSDPVLRDRFLKMKVHGKGPVFVAFEDRWLDPVVAAIEERAALEPSFEHLRVDRIMQEILEFVRERVVPALDPFLS